MVGAFRDTFLGHPVEVPVKAQKPSKIRWIAVLTSVAVLASMGCEDEKKTTKECASGCLKTLAGRTLRGPAEGEADHVSFGLPKGIAVTPDGGIVIADAIANQIRILANGKVTTLAGTGELGHADGPAAQAKLAGPSGVAASADGAVYVADQENHRIRKIKDGIVTTIAGGDASFADGPAVAARFSHPSGVAVLPDGSVLVADFGNHRIRQIKDGQVSTVVGSGTAGLLLGAPLRTELMNPHGLAIEANGAVLIADLGNQRVLRWQGDAVTLVAGQTKEGKAVARSKDGPLTEAGFNGPAALAVTPKGIFVTEWWGNRVRRIEGDKVTTLVGLPKEASGDERFIEGPLAEAIVKSPFGIAALPDGRIALADAGNHRVCVLDP